MDLDTRLQNVAVVGAAGKMGSGIALLCAQEMAFMAVENPGTTYMVNCIDISECNAIATFFAGARSLPIGTRTSRIPSS